MAIIVSILGFMMDPGNWLSNHSLLDGVVNPIYLPQLAFRTPLALVFAALISMTLILFFTKRDDPFRFQAIRAVSLFALVAAPFLLLGGYWYYSVVPSTMLDNLATSLMTLQFEQWQDRLIWGMIAMTALIMLIAQLGILRPNYLPRLLLMVPLLGVVWLTGHFERVREFIRKPFVIGQYMYANGLRVEDYPLYQSEGVLPFATYSHPLSAGELAAIPATLDRDRVQDGKDVFMIACSRCHTGNGVNAITAHFQRMYGDSPWVPELTMSYMEFMHEARPYMPPFPGTTEELEKLAEYLSILQHAPLRIPGAQAGGIALAHPQPDSTQIAAQSETDQ